MILLPNCIRGSWLGAAEMVPMPARFGEMAIWREEGGRGCVQLVSRHLVSSQKRVSGRGSRRGTTGKNNMLADRGGEGVMHFALIPMIREGLMKWFVERASSLVYGS